MPGLNGSEIFHADYDGNGITSRTIDSSLHERVKR